MRLLQLTKLIFVGLAHVPELPLEPLDLLQLMLDDLLVIFLDCLEILDHLLLLSDLSPETLIVGELRLQIPNLFLLLLQQIVICSRSRSFLTEIVDLLSDPLVQLLNLWVGVFRLIE